MASQLGQLRVLSTPKRLEEISIRKNREAFQRPVNDQWPWRGVSARPSRRYRPAISCAPRSKSSASTAMTAAVFCAFEYAVA